MPTLYWIGKHAVVRHHKKVLFRLFEPDKKLSHGDPASGKLIVVGDNPMRTIADHGTRHGIF